MRENRVKKYMRIMAAVMAAVLLLGTNAMDAFAAEAVAAAPMVVIDKYEVTDEKIVPGEDFTLTITLTNYNPTATAKEVLLDIDNPDGVAPVYGTVSQVFVGDIGPGESKEISLEYNSWTTIITNTLDFYVTVITSMNQNYIVLRVPAGSDSPFSVLSANVPESVVVNENLSLSVAFQVLGEDNVSNVALTVYHDGQQIADSQIGILTPGVTKTQQVSMSLPETGEYALELALEYMDTAGQDIVVPIGTALVSVVDSDSVDVEQNFIDDSNVDDSNSETNAILLMGVSGILIIGIFLIVIIILRKNR